jgi:hypothetical protein
MAAMARMPPSRTMRASRCRTGWSPTQIFPLAGVLDDVRIYDRALTASEIQALAAM